MTYGVCCLFALFGYMFLGTTSLLYEQPLAGMLPVDMAVMVLVKQVAIVQYPMILMSYLLFQFLPDSIVLTTPVGRLKYTHLPMTLFTLTLVTSVIGLSFPVAALQAAISMQVAWTYLRWESLYIVLKVQIRSVD